MGVMRWWKICPLPAWGHLSNVSALVLPGARPVAEDAQLPLFSERQRLELLVRACELQRETASIQAALIQQEMALLAGSELPSKRAARKVARVSRPYRPVNERHRTWPGFVEAMQDLERKARALDRKPTKQAICQLGSDSPKTVTRTMRHYGLHADDWPPSTWNKAHMPARGHV